MSARFWRIKDWSHGHHPFPGSTGAQDRYINVFTIDEVIEYQTHYKENGVLKFKDHTVLLANGEDHNAGASNDPHRGYIAYTVDGKAAPIVAELEKRIACALKGEDMEGGTTLTLLPRVVQVQARGTHSLLVTVGNSTTTMVQDSIVSLGEPDFMAGVKFGKVKQGTSPGSTLVATVKNGHATKNLKLTRSDSAVYTVSPATTRNLYEVDMQGEMVATLVTPSP